jgi:hypothetical protein
MVEQLHSRSDVAITGLVDAVRRETDMLEVRTDRLGASLEDSTKVRGLSNPAKNRNYVSCHTVLLRYIPVSKVR